MKHALKSWVWLEQPMDKVGLVIDHGSCVACNEEIRAGCLQRSWILQCRHVRGCSVDNGHQCDSQGFTVLCTMTCKSKLACISGLECQEWKYAICRNSSCLFTQEMPQVGGQASLPVLTFLGNFFGNFKIWMVKHNIGGACLSISLKQTPRQVQNVGHWSLPTCLHVSRNLITSRVQKGSSSCAVVTGAFYIHIHLSTQQTRYFTVYALYCSPLTPTYILL